MYKKIVRPLLFCFDPERVHHLTFFLIRIINKIPGVSSLIRNSYLIENKKLERTILGIKFPNPIGLAAGFDKNAKLFNQLSNFGFGFIEIGTITPNPQPGNPKKRIFRLPKDKGIINRMGINNEGVSATINRLKKNKRTIIGGNIGKNTTTPNNEALADYVRNFKELHPYVDYFVINVSCPNVTAFTQLQDKDFLIKLSDALAKINNDTKKRKPILLKISPDLNSTQLDEIVEIINSTALDGVVATNTTTSRENLTTIDEKVKAIGNGGLSGKPLSKSSTEVIKYLSMKSNKSFPIIGVGGIHSVKDAMEKINAGADLIQLYTGFIYEGPALIKKINSKIIQSSK